MAIRDLRSLSVALEPKMSGLPPKADMCSAIVDVRFTPNSGHEMAIRDLRSLSVALEPKMSALPPIADICSALVHVRFGPIADIDDPRVIGVLVCSFSG